MATEQEDALQQALHKRGAIIRLQTFDKRVVVNLYWMPPTDIPENMRPFTSAMPQAFIKDLRGNGFVAAKEQLAGNLKKRIFAGAWESEEPEALEIAQALAAAHFSECLT